MGCEQYELGNLSRISLVHEFKGKPVSRLKPGKKSLFWLGRENSWEFGCPGFHLVDVVLLFQGAGNWHSCAYRLLFGKVPISYRCWEGFLGTEKGQSLHVINRKAPPY